ncbi:glutamate-5-semialdehyde dehydrogenase [Stella humosa]|uniref:Gamma-glutamyl phosphate reductase n=1 Tax=Stella humosa TaxID=94 RepID=A0A3N1L447_9PROT|nr:glutamate-5-semialdehyde dehydrogenase [Stella humosa]ROP84185.1 glutamate-5-semialdehyde dehydrogenase [Stella humosa]BBK33697.1 gamma-glutamyl phosphate reductase [Stella humosa]
MSALPADTETSDTQASDSLADQMARLGRDARAAAARLSTTPAAAKNQALAAAADAIRQARPAILAANAADLEDARRAGLSGAMVDRLLLNDARVEAMARGLEEVAALPDPVGDTLAEWTRPNGLRIARVRVPLGVIGIIFESRPNVTADAAGLCLKSGNAAILRPGSESFRSSRAILAAMQAGLAAAGLPAAAVQMVPTADRAAVGILLGMSGVIDVIVPRGGRGLIERVIAESRVPVIRHLDGNCHVYVDGAADLAMARAIVGNAKLRRTGVCGAAESLLVDRRAAATHLAPIVRDLLDGGCEVRGSAEVAAIDPRVVPATEADWSTEYLDAVISATLVDGVEGAIAHIERYGSHHTDAIVTDDETAAARFLAAVDSAVVLHNASTQFTDGGEFGMGAEIGISTDKLHARGPVGAEQLTSYKYVVRGSGQLRP